jgi:hypothetical protein
MAACAHGFCDARYKLREVLCQRPRQIAEHAMQSSAGVKYLTANSRLQRTRANESLGPRKSGVRRAAQAQIHKSPVMMRITNRTNSYANGRARSPDTRRKAAQL